MSQSTIYKDGTYLANNPTWGEEDSPWKAKQIIKMLNKHNIVPSTVCEVGCGAGEILNCLAKKYTDEVVFSGFDISPQAFEICKRKKNKNIHFFLKDLLEEKDLVFDVVLAIDVFEHVEDYIGFLRRLREKGTYKIFHIPLDLSVLKVLLSSPIIAGRLSLGHIHYFTKEIALAALKDTGYEVLDSFYTRGPVELPNQGWRSNLLNIPRRVFFSLHQDLAVRVLGGASLLVLAK